MHNRLFGRPQPLWSPPDEVGAAAPSPSPPSSSDSGAGASSAPSVAPESPASRGPASPPDRAPGSGSTEADAGGTPGAGGDSFDFIRDIFGDTSGRSVDPGVALETAPQQSKQPKPPEAAPAAPVPPTPPVEVAQKVAEQPAAPPVQQGGQTPQYDPADPHSLARGLVEHEAAALESLAKVFALGPAEIEALETDFAGSMPKLLAKAALFSQTQFLAQLGNILPQMLQRQQQQTQKHQENASRFYQAWPGIDQTKHGEVVNQLGIRYRKMFPEATLDQMIEQLGPLVLTAIGAQPTTMQRAPQASQPGPVRGNGVRAQSPAGFAPANPGQVVQSQQVQENPFQYMGSLSE